MSRLLRLLAYYRPFYAWMALGVLASTATLLANVTLMATSGWFITSMALAGAAQASMNYFTPAAIIRGAAIVRTGGRYAERLITHQATLRLLSALRVWFYRRLEPLAPSALQGHHSADLLSRIRADIDTLDNFYLRLLVPVFSAVLVGTLLVVYLAGYGLALAWVLLFTLIAAGAVLPWVVSKMARVPGRRKLALLTRQRAALVDSVQGMAELLVYGAAVGQVERVRQGSRELVAEQSQLAQVQGLSRAGLLWLSGFALWLMLWVAIPMVGQGTLTKPDLALLALFTLAAFEAVMPLPQAFQAFGETLAAARRLFEIVDKPPVVKEPADPSPEPRHYGIRFDAVSFTYPGSAAPVLDNMALTLEQGERITIMGPSGAGKSTLVNLLVRFYDPDSGSVTLGDIPLTRFQGEDIRRYFAVVSQHTHIFTATIRDNLLLADPSASQEAIERACRVARIHDDILAMPDGYDTWLGEAGATLSGGQARRIAIARALLKDAPILILDEPTEGLDATTASEVLDALDRVAEGRTVILITHRRLRGERFGEVWALLDGALVSCSDFDG